VILTIPAAGEIGLVTDAAPQELPPNAWSDAKNMRFRNGYAERFAGHGKVFDTPVITPYSIVPYVTPTSRYWVHIGLTAAYVDDGTTRTNISRVAPYTGAADDRWMCGSLNGVFIANNGVDLPQYWGGNIANKLLDLTAWTSTWRCAVIRPFKNFLIALDIAKGSARYASMVKWSNPADPGTLPASWDATNPANEAGEIDLAETADMLVDAIPMGDTLIIYKERSMYSMQASGDVLIWRFTRIPGDFGMLARGCGVATPAGHVVLVAGDVVIHNGSAPKSILDGRMREWLASNMDQSNYKRSFVVANQNTSEVWVCFPENGQTTCTKALIWNWVSDTLGVRDLPNITDADFGVADIAPGTIDGDSGQIDADQSAIDQTSLAATRGVLMMVSTAPLILGAEMTGQFNGVDFSAYLERKDLALGGDTENVKLIRSISPRIDGPTGTVLTIEVGGTMDVEVEPTYSASITYVIGSTRKADCFVAGRFHAIRVSSNGATPWRIKSFDIDYVTQGRY